MAKYEISDEVMRVLNQLLLRTDLKGAEVQAYNACINALSAPIKEEEE